MPFSAENLKLGAIVLSAGKGTRMYSEKPKVLLNLLGEPIISYVYRTLENILDRKNIWTVVGHRHELLQDCFPERANEFILQEAQLGTGHAFSCACPVLQDHGYLWCLVVNGDAPLMHADILWNLVQESSAKHTAVGFITMEPEDPTGYGRVLRDGQGRVQAIVEQKDLSGEAREIETREVNAGVYCFNLSKIGPYLPFLTNNNKQGEYYITQLVSLAIENQEQVLAVQAGNDPGFLGINTSKELSFCEKYLHQDIVNRLQDNGVILHNPELMRIGPLVNIKPGAELTGPLEIYGQSRVEAGACIESHVWIKDSYVGESSWIRNFSHLDNVRIEGYNEVGPYARLRPGAQLNNKAKVGNFVEVKKSVLGIGCKVNHLSYIGDCEIGAGSNIGAGTITCNYDGKRKHKTFIGEQSFIGSNTSLVAPLKIGNFSVIGAGSTITKDVPEKALAVARQKQKNLIREKSKKQES